MADLYMRCCGSDTGIHERDCTHASNDPGDYDCITCQATNPDEGVEFCLRCNQAICEAHTVTVKNNPYCATCAKRAEELLDFLGFSISDAALLRYAEVA